MRILVSDIDDTLLPTSRIAYERFGMDVNLNAKDLYNLFYTQYDYEYYVRNVNDIRLHCLNSFDDAIYDLIDNWYSNFDEVIIVTALHTTYEFETMLKQFFSNSITIIDNFPTSKRVLLLRNLLHKDYSFIRLIDDSNHTLNSYTDMIDIFDNVEILKSKQPWNESIPIPDIIDWNEIVDRHID